MMNATTPGSLRLRCVAVTSVAIIVAGALPARALPQWSTAGAHVISGSVHVTLDAECPDDYKVALAGASSDGVTWTFVLDGAQATCTPRYSIPLTFEGRYVPTAPPCDRTNGEGCPRNIDHARPGYLSVGSLPRHAVLNETTVKYCVAARCYLGRAFLQRVSVATQIPISGDPVSGAIAGIGQVTPPGCGLGEMKMPITATSDGGPVWLVLRPASAAPTCETPVFGVPNVFLGSWSPQTGGCVLSITSPGTSLCLSRVPRASGVVTAGMALCFPGPSCWTGFATLVRT